MSTCVYFYLYLKQIHLRELIPIKGPGEAKRTDPLPIPAATLLTQIYRAYFSYVALSASGALPDLPLWHADVEAGNIIFILSMQLLKLRGERAESRNF